MIRVVYDFASGPMLWFSTAFFFCGLAYRLVRYRVLMSKARRGLPADFRPAWAAASIARFLLPLNRTARSSPWSTLAGFGMHIPLLVVGLFLSAHVIMLEQRFGLSWPTIPDVWADGLTLLALASLVFLAAKRLFHPSLKGLTEGKDLAILCLVALPLLTGLAARLQWGDYPLLLTLHILSAHAVLVAAPFTKLTHMVFFFVSRAATGSDFGKREVGPW
jgi:nitrate reductase gamma subunit